MRPYLFMSVFYASMAVLMAVDSSLVSFKILPGHPGLVWLRIHLITIGTVSQALFGILPLLVANRAGRARPPLRWDVWLTLNAGLLVLIVGMPLVNPTLLITGGLLVFTAVTLLIGHLRTLGAGAPRQPEAGGKKFYIAGLAYLLLGIIIGTGLFLNWGKALRIATPIEVHIHANNWGFMALVFAGLLVDLFPRLFGRPLASTGTIRALFWMMSLGALGLVIGPWVQPAYTLAFSVPGLILHLSATLWLLARVIKSLRHQPDAWGPGLWHIITSYFWFLAPVLIAPMIIFKVPGFPGAGIEANAPQALVYGWVLHFGYALIPYLLSSAFTREKPATLGGSWFSLITVHVGGLFLWSSIFLQAYRGPLRGLAYGFWLVSLIPIAVDLWRILREGLAGLTQTEGSWGTVEEATAPVPASRQPGLPG